MEDANIMLSSNNKLCLKHYSKQFLLIQTIAKFSRILGYSPTMPETVKTQVDNYDQFGLYSQLYQGKGYPHF